jgi:hypothetical protein
MDPPIPTPPPAQVVYYVVAGANPSQHPLAHLGLPTAAQPTPNGIPGLPGIPIYYPANPPHLNMPAEVPTATTQPPVAATAFAGGWIVSSEYDQQFCMIGHGGECLQCRDHAEHLRLSVEAKPIPDDIKMQFLNSVLARYKHEYYQTIHSYQDPNRYPLGPPTSHSTHPSLLNRMNGPSHGASLANRLNPRQPRSGTRIRAAQGTCECDNCAILRSLNVHLRSVIPPVYRYRDEHRPFTHHWIPNPGDFGFDAPAPLLLIPFSHFQDMASFFTVSTSTVHGLGSQDQLRFARASLNTHPDLRTPAMHFFAVKHRLSLLPASGIDMKTPYGMAEQHWAIMDNWMKHPRGAPTTVRCDENNRLLITDTLTHLWVSQVTWGKNAYLVNLLLVLFSNRAAAMQYIWSYALTDHVDPGRYKSGPTMLFPWQLRVPSNTAFHGDYECMHLDDLTAYLIFLVEVARFPIYDRSAVNELCDWADAYISGERCNSFAEDVSEYRWRIDLVQAASIGQPWTDPEHAPFEEFYMD